MKRLLLLLALMALLLGCDKHMKWVTCPTCATCQERCPDAKCEANEHPNEDCKCVPNEEAR